jgi:ABC-type uncharacterized transport system substrate-binding protein
MKLKAMKFKVSEGLLPLIIFTSLINGCQGKVEDTPEVFDVVIVNLLTYPILDDSVSGIKQSLAANFDSDEINITTLNANGDMALIPAMTNEIIAQAPDLIIPVSTPIASAVVSAAPQTQQIVFSTVTNPEDIGYSKTLSNVTGVSDSVNYSANLDLIVELFPEAKTIGIIYNPTEQNSLNGTNIMRDIVTEKNLEVRLATVSNSSDVASAAILLKDQVDVLFVGPDNTVVSAMPSISNVFTKPIIASDEGSVKEGALAAISVDYTALGNAVGEISTQILNGKKVAEIDNIFFEGNALIINMKSAESLNFVFPANIETRAAKKY